MNAAERKAARAKAEAWVAWDPRRNPDDPIPMTITEVVLTALRALDALDAMDVQFRVFTKDAHEKMQSLIERLEKQEAENAKLRAAGDALEAALSDSYSGRDDPGATFLARRTDAQAAWAAFRKEASDGA